MESPFVSRDLARRVLLALLWRGAGMGGEKVIFLVRLIVLARLLTPEDFGLVAIGMTVLAITLHLTDFGVVAALIQQPATDKRHLDTAWTIGLLRGTAVSVVLLLAAPWIAAAFQEPRASDIIRALSLNAVIQAAASIEVARLNRQLRFRELAGTRLSAAIVNTIVAIALAPGYGPFAIVWGAIAGALTQTASTYVVAPYRPGLRLSDEATASIVRFGRWIFLIGVLAVASEGLLRWLIATQLGVAELGLFFMAARLAFLPSQLATGLVNEVAFPLYAELQTNPEKAVEAFRKILVGVAAFLVPACLVFLVLVPDLVVHVLGERWEGATAVMSLLILSTIVGLLGDCVTPVLKGTGRPSGVAKMDALQFVVIVILALPMTTAFGLAGAGLVWLVAAAASQVLATGYIRRLFTRPFAGLVRPTIAILAISAISMGAAALMLVVLPGVIGIAAALLAATGAGAALTLLLDRQLGLGILQAVFQPFPRLRGSTGGGAG